MDYTFYTLFIPAGQVAIDGSYLVSGVNMASLPADVKTIRWNVSTSEGEIEYKETGGITPPNLAITSATTPVDFTAQITEADDILNAQLNPIDYYFTAVTTYEGEDYNVGDLYISTVVGHPAPPNTTTLVPPTATAAQVGQTLQWTGSAWTFASFDITLPLPAVKAELISQTTQNGASAVNHEVQLYSTVQQITAPDVTLLDTVTYPGSTIGDFQTYVDGVVASSVATINAAVTVSALYSFNPSYLPFTPSASGVMSTGRGSGLGPLDMNVSYYTTWTSASVAESDTELYIPGTATVISYGSGGTGKFDSMGNCFTTGDYRVQIRQVSTGFLLAEYECPLSPTNVNVSF